MPAGPLSLSWWRLSLITTSSPLSIQHMEWQLLSFRVVLFTCWKFVLWSFALQCCCNLSLSLSQMTPQKDEKAYPAPINGTSCLHQNNEKSVNTYSVSSSYVLFRSLCKSPDSHENRQRRLHSLPSLLYLQFLKGWLKVGPMLAKYLHWLLSACVYACVCHCETEKLLSGDRHACASALWVAEREW